jgi:hypothetical protein
MSGMQRMHRRLGDKKSSCVLDINNFIYLDVFSNLRSENNIKKMETENRGSAIPLHVKGYPLARCINVLIKRPL